MTTETTPEKARELAERLGRLRAPYRIHYVVEARDALISLSDQVERLNKAAEPWADYHGDLPDYDHPFRCVFESGIQYAVELLAKSLNVDDYEICEGTEEFDGDLSGTLFNIVLAAMPKDEDGDPYYPRELADQVERLTGEQCSCGEVAGEDPDCTLHGRNTLWGKENPDMPMFADHLTALTKERDALRGAVTKCRAQFDFYAREHRSANKLAKAETNQQFADLCDAALNKEAK